ncbi:MAG: MarR family winged helix-turn-helix transcriptional regulator [Acetivibrionales bacterium]|jgi:DNA-binding MarR family transcriptional regulator
MIETDVIMQMKETHQRLAQMMQLKIDEYGLTFGLLYLIMLIEKNPDASQKELAKEMRFTEGAMSSAVKRLQKLNMLEQISLKSDMRYNRLIVTRMGKSMINDYRGYFHKRYKDMFNGFTHEELVNLRGYLKKINVNLENMNRADNQDN